MPTRCGGLKKLRLSNGRTQKDVADGIGVSQANYAKKERGNVAVTLDEIEQFADYYKVSIGDVIGINDDSLLERGAMQEIRDLSKLVVKLNQELEKKNEEIVELKRRLRER